MNVGCEWGFRTKYNPDSSIARYKAWLVAEGYHRVQGVDLVKTFNLIVKKPTDESFDFFRQIAKNRSFVKTA